MASLLRRTTRPQIDTWKSSVVQRHLEIDDWRPVDCFDRPDAQARAGDLTAVDVKALGFKGTAEQRELAVQYIAGAFMAVLTWWVDRGAKLPPPDVDALFRRLVMRGLQGGTSLIARYRAARRGSD